MLMYFESYKARNKMLISRFHIEIKSKIKMAKELKNIRSMSRL